MATSGDISRVQYATGTDTDDGDYSTALVAAVAGKKIRVIALSVTVLTTAGVVGFKGTGSNTGTVFQAHLALGTPFVMSTGSPYIGLFETATGEGVLPTNGNGVDSFVNCSFVTVEP